MISFAHKGSFRNTEKFFSKALATDYMKRLEDAGREGLLALAAATPKDSGKTAASWVYTVVGTKHGMKLLWSNENEVNGEIVAILIQYGHGTKSGGYVAGRDFINPALRPVFDKIANDIWREVIS